MALRSRVKEIWRLCSLYGGHFETNQQDRSRILVPVSKIFSLKAHSSLFEASQIVRFYAAPPEANQKKEEKDSREPKLNEEITVPSVRLVTSEGHFLVSRYEALSRAKSLKLDLVMVDGQATPPVCKIFDYKKEKYVQQMKEKERAKCKQSVLKKGSPKEIRFSGKITQKDLQVKADMVKRLMESGHRVKCTAIEPTDTLDMETMLSRFSALIDDVAFVESGPKVEKKQAFVVVRHVKFGPTKKGSSKKASKSATEDASDSTDEDDQTRKFNKDAVFGVAFDTPSASPKLETQNRYAKVSPKPEMENRYAKVPSKTEFGNRYAKVPPIPGAENRYANASPRLGTENRYAPRSDTENAYANAPSMPGMGNRYAKVPLVPGAESRYANASPRPVTENRYAPRPDMENAYANVPSMPGMENRYAKVPPLPGAENRYANASPRLGTDNRYAPRPDMENSYANVPPMQGMENRYAQVPSRPGMENRYTRVSPLPGSHSSPRYTNDAASHPQDRSQTDVTKPYLSNKSFGAHPVPDLNTTEVLNRYKKSNPS